MLEPACYHLEAGRVDTRQERPRQKSQHQSRRHSGAGDKQESRVGERTGDSTGEKEGPRTHDVGEVQYGRHQGANDEAELNGQRETRFLGGSETPQ